MKKFLLLILILFVTITGKTQVTYFNYLDTTVVWKYFQGGWDGVQSYNSYKTFYFDGDTLINGKYYYKEYMLSYDTTFAWTGTNIIDTVLSGPSYLREDSLLKYYNYNTMLDSELVSWDWQSYLNLQVNDNFNIPNGNCTIQNIDTLYLGARPLKECHSSLPSPMPNSTLEGIGILGPLCAIGNEGNGFYVCFKKQNDSLQFNNSYDCNAFPIPFRNNHFTNIKNEYVSNQIIKLFPNPFNEFLNIKISNNQLIEQAIITNQLGIIVEVQKLNTSDLIFNTQILPKGVYVVHLKGRNIDEHYKVIKQ